MRSAASLVLAALCCFAPLGCGPGNQGDAAGNEQEQADEAPPRQLTLHGERMLAYIEHPELVQGAEARFLVHLTVSATGEPVRAGSVVLRIGDSEYSVAAPKRDGLFVPTGLAPRAGSHAARLEVRSEQGTEFFDLGAATIHADSKAADALARQAAHEARAGSVSFLLETQWQVKLLLAQAGPATIDEQAQYAARIEAQDGAEAVVSSTVGGRLSTVDGRQLPRLGDTLEAGQIVGWIEPPLDPGVAAELRAQRLQAELESAATARQLAQAQADLKHAELAVRREQALRENGLGLQKDLDEALRASSVAQAAVEAAQASQRALDEAQRARAGRGDDAQAPRTALVAPLGGTVVHAAAVAGAAVAAGEPLYRTLDTRRLRATARVPERDLPRLSSVGRIELAMPATGGTPLRFEAGALRQAASLDAASRTLAVHLDFDAPSASWKPGLSGELLLRTGAASAPVAIPLEAVVLDQGIPTAYVMVSGESFERRVLELGPRDGRVVQVRAGLAAGERVATRGANLVRLASMAPEGFGHGHAH